MDPHDDDNQSDASFRAIQKAWRASTAHSQVKIDMQELSRQVHQVHHQFQQVIWWRDLREVGVALTLIPAWLVMGTSLSLPWSWYLTIPALLWVAGFMLIDRRRYPQRPSAPGEPLSFYATEALQQVEHQIWLLRNVFWWYLLPFASRS